MQSIMDYEPSYELADGRGMSVSLGRAGDWHDDTRPAVLRELSQTRMSLAVSTYVPFGEAVRLKLEAEDSDLALDILGEVQQIGPSRTGQWLMECSINTELSEKTLTEFALEGHLERRENTRHATYLPAFAGWELGKGKTPVVLLNYSTAGFCLLGRQPGKTGHRIMLRFRKPDGKQASVAAKIQWSEERDDTHLVGCSYLDHRGARHFRGIARPTKNVSAPKSTPEPTRRQPYWHWIVVGFLGVLVSGGIYAYRKPAEAGQSQTARSTPVVSQSTTPNANAPEAPQSAVQEPLPSQRVHGGDALRHGLRALARSTREGFLPFDNEVRGAASQIETVIQKRLEPLRRATMRTLERWPPKTTLEQSAGDDPQADLQQPVILLRNPHQTRSDIHYTVDGIAFSLQPGQEHDLTADQTQTLRLHRGGDFPDVSYLLSAGTYTFTVSETGWELVETREPPSDTRP